MPSPEVIDLETKAKTREARKGAEKETRAALRVIGRAVDILSAEDVKYDLVPTPEWGEGTGVRVRSLSSGELESWQNSLWTDKMIDKAVHRVQIADGRARARMAVLGCVDETGRRIFGDDDLEPLNAKSAAVVQRLADRIQELSKATPEEQKKLGEDSSAGRSGASGSASPSPSAAPSPS